MTTTFRTGLPAIALLLAAAIALVAVTGSSAQGSDTSYTVTVENLTDNQPLTPPVVIAHASGFDAVTVGEAASSQLQQVAENGNNDPLVQLAEGSADVMAVTTGTAPIMPGESATLEISAPAGSLLSAVMMLICTNDGFTGVDSMELPASGSQSVETDAYDAGTEMNTEDFADMVPPCQELSGVSSDDEGTGESNADLAEGGVVAAHAGIQGGTDLTVADHGWTDPVAQITVAAEEAADTTTTLPDSGGAPPSDGSTSWALYAAIAAAVAMLAGGATLMAARRQR